LRQFDQRGALQIEPRDRKLCPLAGLQGDARKLQHVGRWREAVVEVDHMLEALDGDAVQRPTLIVAPDLVLDCVVAEEAADQAPPGPPASVDLDLIGDRGRSPLVIECCRAPKQPTVVAWLQQPCVPTRAIEPFPCRELAQPRAPVTG
jgi:hypothetical protein